MDIRLSRSPIEGVLVIEPDWFQDDRGFFMESYHRARFRDHGLDLEFVQDNHSRSCAGVLRGLHYQNARAPQHRLIRCTVGEIFDVVVDLRVGSPTFGRYHAERLSARNRKQILVPPEFAHGFLVLSDSAEVQYKCTAHHSPAAERGLAWNDPDVGIPWPLANPILSERDSRAPSLRDYLLTPAFPSAPVARAS